MLLSVLDQSTVISGRSPDASIRESLALAKHAEALGYRRYWVAEHHNSDSIAGSAPEVLIAAIAATTQRIRVGSAGVMLPHYSGLKVAEQFRVLAHDTMRAWFWDAWSRMRMALEVDAARPSGRTVAFLEGALANLGRMLETDAAARERLQSAVGGIAVSPSDPGARPSPRSMRPGAIASSTRNCSATFRLE